MPIIIKMDSEPLKLGGHCRIAPGEQIGSWTVIECVGRGSFASVFACKPSICKYLKDVNLRMAIKLYRSDEYFARYYQKECEIITRLNKEYTGNFPRHILKDWLVTNNEVHKKIIEVSGQKHTIEYPLIAYDLHGDHLGRLMRKLREGADIGLPMAIADNMMRQICAGLAALHKAQIIHADIKLDNILMDIHVDDIEDGLFANVDDLANFAPLCAIQLVIADLGSATIAGEIYSRSVGTAGYKSPECCMRIGFDTAADIWSAGAVYFELVTAARLFDVYKESAHSYGDDIDEFISRTSGADEDTGSEDSIPELVDEDFESRESFESYSSGESSDLDGSYFENYNTLLIAEILFGRMPHVLSIRDREYFDASGALKYHPGININPTLSEFLKNNYCFDINDSAQILRVISSCCQYYPQLRSTADEMLTLIKN